MGVGAGTSLGGPSGAGATGGTECDSVSRNKMTAAWQQGEGRVRWQREVSDATSEAHKKQQPKAPGAGVWHGAGSIIQCQARQEVETPEPLH